MKSYRHLNVQKLNRKLNWACRKGHLDTVKYLLSSPELTHHAVMDKECFITLCESGHLPIIQYFVTENLGDIHRDNYWCFRRACAKGYLDVIRYLLTSPELKEKGYANIHAENDYGIKLACANGHIQVVKYLLTGSSVKFHDYCFSSACEYGQVEVVKYLLDNFQLDEDDKEGGFILACANGHLNLVKYFLEECGVPFVNIHTNDDKGFISACSNGHLPIVNYLILEQDIPITQAISYYLNGKPQLLKLFQVRERYHRLNSILAQKPKVKKSVKI